MTKPVTKVTKLVTQEESLTLSIREGQERFNHKELKEHKAKIKSKGIKILTAEDVRCTQKR